MKQKLPISQSPNLAIFRQLLIFLQTTSILRQIQPRRYTWKHQLTSHLASRLPPPTTTTEGKRIQGTKPHHPQSPNHPPHALSHLVTSSSRHPHSSIPRDAPTSTRAPRTPSRTRTIRPYMSVRRTPTCSIFLSLSMSKIILVRISSILINQHFTPNTPLAPLRPCAHTPTDIPMLPPRPRIDHGSGRRHPVRLPMTLPLPLSLALSIPIRLPMRL